MILAYAITLALLARERYGSGQNVETSQLGAMMFLMQSGIHQVFIGNQQPRRISRSESKNPLSNTYKCAGGEWLSMAGGQSDRWFNPIVRMLDRDEVLEDPRFGTMDLREEHQDELVRIFDEAFAERPRQHWLGSSARSA